MRLLGFLSTLFTLATSSTSFLSIGDWGGFNLGSYHKTNVQHVSTQMKSDIHMNTYEAVLNTGDNFYYCGIQNLDDSNIQPDYLDTFGTISLPWVSALGNHDYGYNVSAQLGLSSIVPNWVMPSRYYKQTFKDVHIIVLDTSPCIQDYRNDDPAGWDPCGVEYPTCTPYVDPQPCRFHENIVTQSCTTQREWFRKEVDTYSNMTDQWLIVIGHHPVYELSDPVFAGLIDTYADLYINGHTHLLASYTYNQHNKYIVSGAGSMVSSYVSLNTTPFDWFKQVSGYTRHHVLSDKIVTEFIDTNGIILHTVTHYRS